MVLTAAQKSARYRAKDVEAYRARKNALVKLPHHKEQRRLYAKQWRDRNKKPRKPRPRKWTDEQLMERKREYARKHAAANREKLRLRSAFYYQKYKADGTILARQRKYSLKKKYGITPEQYQEMLLKQDSKCAICLGTMVTSGARHMHVDHCHETGRIRGILCHVCNTKLGWFERFRAQIKRYLDGKASLEGS
jgi:hypothetical protein